VLQLYVHVVISQIYFVCCCRIDGRMLFIYSNMHVIVVPCINICPYLQVRYIVLLRRYIIVMANVQVIIRL